MGMDAEQRGHGSAAPPPAILRGAHILRIIADRNGAPLTATAAAKALAIPRSSAVNICVALEEVGFVRSGPLGYSLGPALGELGQAYVNTFAPVRHFTEFCQTRRPPSFTVQLGTLDVSDVVYLARHDGTDLVTIASRVGGRLPANCTGLGKAMLGSLDDAQLERVFEGWDGPLVALTPRSIRDFAELRNEVRKVAELGYAIDDEETTPGVVCVAVPLARRQDLSSVYAVSGSILKADATEARISSAVRELEELARATSGRGDELE